MEHGHVKRACALRASASALSGLGPVGLAEAQLFRRRGGMEDVPEDEPLERRLMGQLQMPLVLFGCPGHTTELRWFSFDVPSMLPKMSAPKISAAPMLALGR